MINDEELKLVSGGVLLDGWESTLLAMMAIYKGKFGEDGYEMIRNTMARQTGCLPFLRGIWIRNSTIRAMRVSANHMIISLRSISLLPSVFYKNTFSASL